jgi:hypothetical protein
MPRTLHHLKPLTVKKAKTPGRYSDGGGLYLVVKPGPRKSWAFIYRRGAKTTELGLGSVADVALVDARAEATELRKALSDGADPRAHRERKRQALALLDARTVTFEAAARRYHERHRAKWHSDQYAHQWLRMLEIHAFPKIGTLGIGTVDLAAVRSVIEPIWYDKPRAAQQVRANVESVLDMAHADGQRAVDNPARWDLLKHTLPARKGARTAGHFRALAYAEVPALLADLAADPSISAVCMRFAIFTVARTNESDGLPVDRHRLGGPHERRADPQGRRGLAAPGPTERAGDRVAARPVARWETGLRVGLSRPISPRAPPRPRRHAGSGRTVEME